MPRFLPAGLTQFFLTNYTPKPPPYHVTADDVSTPVRRLEVGKITGHQLVRGRGGVIAVMYETHWKGLLRPSWEREMDLQHSRKQILLYWAGTPDQHRQTNRLYRRMRIGAAERELSCIKRERSSSPGYEYVPLRRLGPPFSQHRAACWRTLLVQGSRCSLVARENLRTYSNYKRLHRSLPG